MALYLGENIRYLRRQHGWSQDYLAELLGYKSYTTIQKWESGVSEPPLKKAHEIASLFNIDIDVLTKISLENIADDYWSSSFRSNLAHLLESVDSADAASAGIDLPHLSDIADGNAPLSLFDACSISDQFGIPLCNMVGQECKTPTPGTRDGLDAIDIQISDIILKLTPAKKQEALRYLQYLESREDM